MSPDRRQFLGMGAAALLALHRGPDGYSPALRAARDAVRSGTLGEVTFCRVFSDGSSDTARLLDAARYALGKPEPGSITAQHIGNRLRFATLRYPGCIVSYESRDTGGSTIVFHGTLASSRVDFPGASASRR